MSLNTRLFVSNLPENTDKSDLISAFSAYGKITNIDVKIKSNTADEHKKFAFINLTASNYDIETCINYFSSEHFKGHKLYVTRARESFLERLQREREQTQNKDVKHDVTQREKLSKECNPTFQLKDKVNLRKRKLLDGSRSKTENEASIKDHTNSVQNNFTKLKPEKKECTTMLSEEQKKKIDSDNKRMESIKMKRQEFQKKKMIIKTGLTCVDKAQNIKILFSDHNENAIDESLKRITIGKNQPLDGKKMLFDENDSGDEVNFEIKEHLEGKKGQKILDLQSRYKSDKRFVLDERFIEEQDYETEANKKEKYDHDQIETEQTDEKIKQLNILQDVLGVAIKIKSVDQDNKKSKIKMGMFRYDPSQPEHAKFVVPIEDNKQDLKKKSKKKQKDKIAEKNEEISSVIEAVEVSKEQFYKVSETLKETIAQTTPFSLRSLFTTSDNIETESLDQDATYIPIERPIKPKIKNPLDPGEKNPFVYDSSDSETEDVKDDVKTDTPPLITDNNAVWKENLFFSQLDHRFKEGLEFFNKTFEKDTIKERRELKSLMKKRIYNKERKTQLFQKKIGGRKKIIKKTYRKK